MFRATTTGWLPDGYRAAVLEFRILGPLEVVGEHGLALRLGGPKQRATLAILLLNANSVVSVERLADDLYSGAAPVTAVTQVQRQVSELRKVLGSASMIETRPPGYVIRVAPDQLDVGRFERLTQEASRAAAHGDSARAATLFRDALRLRRGPPLADLTYAPFAQPSIERLDEIHLSALEGRVDADLAVGRHAEVVGELEQLVAEHPLRERFRAQLMVALYRSGRQAEALAAYRSVRAALVEQFGIEPTAALRDLERAILTHAPSLELSGNEDPLAHLLAGRALLVIATDDDRLEAPLAVAERLAHASERELIVVRLAEDEDDLVRATAGVKRVRASLPVPARTAAFTSADRAADVHRLATAYDAELVLMDAPPGLAGAGVPKDLAATFERSPADVAVATGVVQTGDGIFVPFGGGEHDWAALELASWLSLATRESLVLVGTSADPRGGRRDASRLLADASLAVQRVVGVETESVLAEPSEEGLIAAVGTATIVVVGISERWRRLGIGESRRALVRASRSPILLVHRGPRPGGFAPRGSRTRFTWTVDRSYLQGVSTAAT